MKNEKFEDIICPNWLINISKTKEKTFLGKKRKKEKRND